MACAFIVQRRQRLCDPRFASALLKTCYLYRILSIELADAYKPLFFSESSRCDVLLTQAIFRVKKSGNFQQPSLSVVHYYFIFEFCVFICGCYFLSAT